MTDQFEYQMKCRACGDTGTCTSMFPPPALPTGQTLFYVETTCEQCIDDGKGEIPIASPPTA